MRSFKAVLWSTLAVPALWVPATVQAQIAPGPDQSGNGGEMITPASQNRAGQTDIITPSIQGVPKIFLPDIGIGADFAYQRNTLSVHDARFSPAMQQPQIRDGQIVAFSPIDPYTNAQFTLDVPQPGSGAANVEEAWLHFQRLPGGVTARIGRFLPQFGLLDQLNTFQLATLNRPSAIGAYIGSDGMIATGLELNAYVPNPWDLNIKADVNAVQGNVVGGCPGCTDAAFLGTLDYSRDLFITGSFQAGVSVAQAPSPTGLDETLYEPYMQIIYAPSQRRIWTWSAEGMLAQRQGLGAQNGKRGFYTYLDYNFALRYHVGMLVDMADAPVAPYGTQLDLAPNFTWFVSDNTRLRLQYTHTTSLPTQRAFDAVALQATYSLGNLKQLQ